jgi:hypothetical protein
LRCHGSCMARWLKKLGAELSSGSCGSRRNEYFQNAANALKLLHSDCIEIANDSPFKDRRILFSDLELKKWGLEEFTRPAKEIEGWVDLTTLQSADVFRIDLKSFGKRTLLNSGSPSCRSKSFAK